MIKALVSGRSACFTRPAARSDTLGGRVWLPQPGPHGGPGQLIAVVRDTEWDGRDVKSCEGFHSYLFINRRTSASLPSIAGLRAPAASAIGAARCHMVREKLVTCCGRPSGRRRLPGGLRLHVFCPRTMARLFGFFALICNDADERLKRLSLFTCRSTYFLRRLLARGRRPFPAMGLHVGARSAAFAIERAVRALSALLGARWPV
jgi:hypothetical protein